MSVYVGIIFNMSVLIYVCGLTLISLLTCPNIPLAQIATGSGIARSNNRRVELMYTIANTRTGTFHQKLTSTSTSVHLIKSLLVQ